MAITTTFFIFSLYCTLIPLILGFWQELLYSFHLGILWTCLLFSFLPERFFVQDYQDGTLEFYYLSRFAPCNLILFSKLIGFWLLKISGILLSYPVLSLFYRFEIGFVPCFTLIVGSFIFLMICSLHSCITVGLQKTQVQNGLHYLTTLPSLLPLILLCNYIQTESTHFVFLFGLAAFYFLLLNALGSHILKNAISQ
jgi:heme exporter protein CcmB